jgi:hypothetical protein
VDIDSDSRTTFRTRLSSTCLLVRVLITDGTQVLSAPSTSVSVLPLPALTPAQVYRFLSRKGYVVRQERFAWRSQRSAAKAILFVKMFLHSRNGLCSAQLKTISESTFLNPRNFT